MQPLQILIQNLLYDMSQAAIPWDNVDADYLVRPVSFDIVSVARFMIVFGPLSSIFEYVSPALALQLADVISRLALPLSPSITTSTGSTRSTRPSSPSHSPPGSARGS